MPVKILMVCLGNICRSPLAEGILRSKVNPEKVIVDSAGTGGWHLGNPPDHRSIAIGLQHGIDIRNQRCRQFTVADFDQFDLIFAMDKSNYANLMAMSKTQEESRKIKLLLQEVSMGTDEIPDPYYDGSDGFEKVYRLLDKACEAIAKDLIKKNDYNG